MLVGNEGITFKRYETEDLTIAAARLRKQLPKTVLIGTSEPLVGYKQEFVRKFGDFLAEHCIPCSTGRHSSPRRRPVGAEEAGKLAATTNTPVILKETGFPHAGKPEYTPQSQRDFWAAYRKPGALERPGGDGWVFFGTGFEAFDLPWKSEESKLGIEKSWGMMSPKREPYPAFEVWRAERR